MNKIDLKKVISHILWQLNQFWIWGILTHQFFGTVYYKLEFWRKYIIRLNDDFTINVIYNNGIVMKFYYIHMNHVPSKMYIIEHGCTYDMTQNLVKIQIQRLIQLIAIQS